MDDTVVLVLLGSHHSCVLRSHHRHWRDTGEVPRGSETLGQDAGLGLKLSWGGVFQVGVQSEADLGDVTGSVPGHCNKTSHMNFLASRCIQKLHF